VTPPPAPPPVVAVVEPERPAWRPIVGGVLIAFAIVGVVFFLRTPRLEGQRLVPLGADGLPLDDEVVLAKQQTKRGQAKLELGKGSLVLEARKDGGVDAVPQGVKASIEGVPVKGPTSLVHGMVVSVDDDEGSRPFVYLDRPLTPSERRRPFVEPDEESAAAPKGKTKRKKKASFRTTAKAESISDVASVEEIFVVDESEDATAPGEMLFGDRQVIALDDGGRLSGEPFYFRAFRMDGNSAALDLEGRKVVFEMSPEDGALGARLLPVDGLTIEGVPVKRAGAALVHAMVFAVGEQGFVYFDRDPNESERKRTHAAPRGKGRLPSGREREILVKDSLSDVGSTDEFYVVDDSDDGVKPLPDERTDSGRKPMILQVDSEQEVTAPSSNEVRDSILTDSSSDEKLLDEHYVSDSDVGPPEKS
jgi:hypothetical protein